MQIICHFFFLMLTYGDNPTVYVRLWNVFYNSVSLLLTLIHDAQTQTHQLRFMNVHVLACD